MLAWVRSALPSLNESPSEKEGKFAIGFEEQHFFLPLNESPSEKEGKFCINDISIIFARPQ